MGEVGLIIGLILASIIIDSNVKIRYRILTSFWFVVVLIAMIIPRR